jgi:MFS family permease
MRSSRTPRIFYGWYVLAAAFVLLFLNAGGRTMIGVMVKPIAAELGWSRSAISAAIFLNLAVYALASIVAGRLYDRWGPKWVVAGSTLLFVAGYLLMATMQSLWQFLFYYGVIAAVGFGATTVPIFGTIMGNWFERRRGMAVSLAIAGSCFGQFVLVPLFSDMLEIAGWRSTNVWIALITLVVNLALVFGVIRGDPEKFGLQAYGRRRREGDESPAAVAAVSGRAVDRAADRAVGVSSQGPGDLTLAQAMRTRSLWMYTLIMFVCGAGDYLLMTHVVPMVTDYGISNDVGARMLAWAGLLSLAGVLLTGPAADAVGNKLPIALTFAFRTALYVMIFLYKGPLTFWIYALGIGFTLVITAVLTTTLVAALYGVKHLGFISGFITTVHMVGGGVWSWVGGYVFDTTGDYDVALLISAAASGLAVVWTLFIRDERHLPPPTPCR